MIKLWNHGLLDANSMNSCNIILETIHSEAADPKSWSKESKFIHFHFENQDYWWKEKVFVHCLCLMCCISMLQDRFVPLFIYFYHHCFFLWNVEISCTLDLETPREWNWNTKDLVSCTQPCLVWDFPAANRC